MNEQPSLFGDDLEAERATGPRVARKESWLTEVARIYHRYLEGVVPWALMGKCFKPIHEHPKFLDRFTRYCERCRDTREYFSPRTFATSFAAWDDATDPREGETPEAYAHRLAMLRR